MRRSSIPAALRAAALAMVVGVLVGGAGLAAAQTQGSPPANPAPAAPKPAAPTPAAPKRADSGDVTLPPDLLTPAGPQAQGKATIKGHVYDQETGVPLPYTIVLISGTNIGAKAGPEGEYVLPNLKGGTYTLKASYPSYELGTRKVILGETETAQVDFRLVVQAIMMAPVEVTGERPLIETEKTGTKHYLSAEQIAAMPVDNMVQMIAQQPGVTLHDNEIHIRGGRSEDTQFSVDGVTVNDPLAGGGYGYQLDASIINEIEVLTGGFNAEYGQAVSGVVNVSTKEGGDRMEGQVSWKRDYLTHIPKNDYLDWRDYSNFNEPQNIDVVKASVSGPDPVTSALRRAGLDLPGQQYLLLAGSADLRDGYLPIFSRTQQLKSPLYPSWMSPRENADWNGMAKWSWHITPRHKINLMATRQVGISQGFSLAGEGFATPFLNALDRYLVFTNEDILTQLSYRQVLGDKDFFELSLGRNFNRQHANVNGSDDFRTYGAYGYVNTQSPTDSLLGTATADRWHDHYSESWTAKGAYAFVGSSTNQFKTGFDLSLTEMQLVDLQTNLANPPAGKLGQNDDIFKVHPIIGALYFQDTITYRGLVVNAGLRGDAWAPGREVEDVLAHHDQYLFIFPDMVQQFQNDTMGFLGRRWKARVSPRLGLSFPVTERDKFFFNYGHFSQWPRYAYVYPQLYAQTASKIQLLGNPNLDPKVTVEYETGVEHEFGGLWSMGVTLYNRDIFGYAKSVSLGQVDISPAQTPDPNDSGTPIPIQPVRYFNDDSARSVGIELTVTKRTTRWLSGSASLELSRSTGTNSTAEEAYLQAAFENYSPTASVGGLRRVPLLWDRPWSFSANLDFSVFDRDRPTLFGWTLPANWSANLLYSMESGQRYTPLTYVERNVARPGDIMSGVGPYKSSLNLRLNKFWSLGRQKLTLFLEGRNILNHKNYRRVNPFTGDGYKVGDYNPTWEYTNRDWLRTSTNDQSAPDLTTNSREYALGVVNPSYVEDPRVLLMGVSWSW